jgi:hypothetical protein
MDDYMISCDRPVLARNLAVGLMAGLMAIAGFSCTSVTSVDHLPSIVIESCAVFGDASRYEEDFSEVRGQESVRRAVVIAAAGGHTILTLGTSARYTVKCIPKNDL